MIWPQRHRYLFVRSAQPVSSLKKGIALTVVGAAIGLAVAFVLTRWMASMLFGISASDPLTYAVVLLVALGAALLACSIPAHRATRVDPLVALRYE